MGYVFVFIVVFCLLRYVVVLVWIWQVYFSLRFGYWL